MEISSIASQALNLKEQMSNSQLGLAALKQAADAQQKMVELLAKSSETIKETSSADPGGFSTYA